MSARCKKHSDCRKYREIGLACAKYKKTNMYSFYNYKTEHISYSSSSSKEEKESTSGGENLFSVVKSYISYLFNKDIIDVIWEFSRESHSGDTMVSSKSDSECSFRGRNVF